MGIGLDRLHLMQRVVEPVPSVGRTVLESVLVRDGVTVAGSQACHMGVDSLFPARPSAVAPSPRVIRLETVSALRAFRVGNGGRPAGGSRYYDLPRLFQLSAGHSNPRQTASLFIEL